MIRSKIAAHLKRATTMTIFWAWLMLALHVLPGAVAPAHAQGTRKDDIVFNSRGTPLAGAIVRICAQPASGQPCTPLANIYSDAGLTQALANPTTSDGMGNYFFYAAPGSYEIEISGAQISTRQIPDVTLPASPASPTFTGTISAFSLNLSGNLSVTGNTTVIGNLASGTLNLSNQSTPPGAASAGTVNLYTKTSDKRLYYKDETGTEIGPLASGSGAQLNVANTFTAPQSIASDFHSKGPNPSFDLQLYGGYLGNSFTPPTISCNVTGGSATLTCAGGTSDFAVGHGVAIATAGVVPGVLTPGAAVGISSISVNGNVATVLTANEISFTNGSSITVAGSSDATFNGTFAVAQEQGYNQFTFPVTHANCGPCTIGGSTTVVAVIPGAVSPQGVLNGATTYNYKVVAVDFNGGLSAASAAFTTNVGASALGLTNVSVTSYSRAGGVTTFTCAANCNLQNGAEINVVYAGSGARDVTVEGPFVISSIPNGTSFTILQAGQLNTSAPVTINDNAQVIAKNLVQWVMQPAAVMQHLIYRCTASCGTNTNYTIAGISQGMDSAFTDWGITFSIGQLPAYLPANPPGAATNGILATTITAINGTQVTLAANAAASVSGATVQHDNTPSVLAACTSSANNGQGGTIFFSQGNAQGGSYVFNSPLPMKSCPAYTKLQLGAQVFLNEPWLSRSLYEIEGLNQASGGNMPSFVMDHVAQITGFSYPLLLFSPGVSLSGGDNTLTNLVVVSNQPYQSGIFLDQDNNGNNVTQLYFRNVYCQGNHGSQPFRMGGGFGFYWDRGALLVSGAVNWGFPPEFLDVVDQGFGANSQQLAGILSMDKTVIGGGELRFDAAGVYPLGSGPGHMSFNETLNESGFYPSFVFNSGNNPVFAVDIVRASYSDPLGGPAVPLIDLTTANVISALRVIDPFCFSGSQPLFAAANQGGIEVTNGVEGCSIIGANIAIVHNGAGTQLSDSYNNASMQFSGTGQVYYAMATPAAPTVAISGATGPAAGTYFYRILAYDVNGNSTVASPISTSITVNGSQGVLVSWTPVPGQVFTTICRGTSASNVLCATTSNPFEVSGSSFLDTFAGFFYTGSLPQQTTAAGAALGANGLSASTLTLPGGGSKDVLSGSFSASRAQTLPDVSGVVPVTGYVNSAYDNATRANGAIGANWTISTGGLNVAGNALQGGTASVHNVGFWSANSFSSFGQFAEVTVTSLNGTTDFIGPMVMVSGTTGYNCIENSANIFLQRYSAGTGTNLTSTAITGAPGDVLRLEMVEPGGALTCYRNGVSILTASDTTFTSGSPGLDMFDNVATSKNWSGGNLHPLSQLDSEADYTKVQHLNAGVGLGTETFTASPRAEQNVFLPGALTSTWTGATWTTDKAVSVTRVQVQAKTAPAGCTTNAIVRLSDGTSPVNVTIAASANDSGAIIQNYAAGASITVGVQTAAAGCATSPADANVVVQYRMQ
jgi:hypothetical protein